MPDFNHFTITSSKKGTPEVFVTRVRSEKELNEILINGGEVAKRVR